MNLSRGQRSGPGEDTNSPDMAIHLAPAERSGLELGDERNAGALPLPTSHGAGQALTAASVRGQAE